MRAVTIGTVAVAVLAATGCATRDWVRETLGTKEAEMNRRVADVEGAVGMERARIDSLDRNTGEQRDRVGQVEARLQQEAQRVEGMGFRVTTVETRATELGSGLKAARERAVAALARVDEVDARLTRLAGRAISRRLVETRDLPFAFARADLNDDAQTALASLVKEMRANPKLSVDLEGFTDPAGGREYNLALSHRRVEAVRRHLVEQGVELPRIQAIGLGPLGDRGVPDGRKRRVTVKLMLQAD
jgi:outer membrane protein OmpA-like peptidoglycan-associated protein